jgi:hypothetical protein
MAAQLSVDLEVLKKQNTLSGTERGLSCHDNDVKFITGCCKGVPGVMHDEHSILCREFFGQSPQRSFSIATYRKDFIPSGETIISLQDSNYIKFACKMMSVDFLDTETFKNKWDSFVENSHKKYFENNKMFDY